MAINKLIIENSSGNVGIGTTSPGAKLQISDSSTPQIRLHWSGTAASGNKGSLLFTHNRNSDGTQEGLGYIQGVAEDNQSAGGIRFVSRNNADVEVMRMISSGNVGIGTASPQVPLHINRSGSSGSQTIVLGLSSDSTRPVIQFSEGTSVSSATGMAIEYDGRGTGGTNAIRINSVDNVPVQTFMSNGWVGFGTSSPVAPLNIVHTNLPDDPYSGIIVKNTDTTGAAYTGVTVDGALQSHYRFAINGGLKYQFRCGYGSGLDTLSLYSWTLNEDFVSFSNTGRVGIGTTNPGRKLDVRLSSSTVYSASSMETSSLFSYMRNPDGTTGAYAGIQFAIANNSDAAIAGIRTADAACAIAFGTRGVGSGAIIEHMRITSTGNVGIGSTNPGNKLTVTGSASFSGGATFGDSTISNFQLLGYENNVIRPTSDGYGGFRLKTFDGSDAGYILMRDTTDVDVYQQYGLTLVTDRGPITLAARGSTIGDNSTRNFIRFMTAGGVGSAQVRMTINKDGHITMPAQPRFYAYGVGGGRYVSSSGAWIYPSTRVNTGSHYNTSNGRFTAPVAGTYAFFWGHIGGSSSTVWRFYFRVNDSVVDDVHLRLDTSATGDEYGSNAARFFMCNLNSGDFITIHFQSDAGFGSYPGGDSATNDYPYFGGYLIG